MHEVIATKVDPATALAVGLKVEVEALPRTIIAALRAGDVDLTNPAVTVPVSVHTAKTPLISFSFRDWCWETGWLLEELAAS